MDGYKTMKLARLQVTAVLALVTLHGAIPRVDADCSDYEVSSCLTIPVNGFASIFKITLEQTGIICSKADSLPSCVEKMGCSGNEPYGKYALALMDGFIYLCHEGTSDFTASRQCLGTDDAQRAFNLCNATYYTVVTNNSLTICSAFTDLLNCYKNGAFAYCGADMEKVYVTYIKKVAPAYSAHIKCSVDEAVVYRLNPAQHNMSSSFLLQISILLSAMLYFNHR
jgi:hypothetical protein